MNASVCSRAAGIVLVALLSLAGTVAAQDERAALAGFEERSRAFYALLERGQRERAADVWPGLAADLAAFQDKLENRLDALRDEVTEQDGDLEALYKSARWRDPEIAALVVTYHLAWVRYQGAQLTGDAAKKTQLLREAADGFSKFLVVNEVPEIYSESLYGRGLAFLDLGEYPKAIEDLTAATNEARVATKARAALDEARRRQTGKQGPAAEDPEALLARLGGLLSRIAGGDAGVEKETTTLARGLAVRGGTWPARVRLTVLDKLGGGTVGGVRSSYGLFLLAQLAVDRGACDDVAPLAAASAEVKDTSRGRYVPELLFLAAACRLNGGHPREAAEGFATLLREFPNAARVPEAAYYRARALAVVRTGDDSVTPTYEESLRSTLTRWPKADAAAELQFMLGELERGRGDCAAAERAYGAVTAGPFATRARLGTLECRVATVGTGPDAGARRREAIDGLRAFARDTPARGEDEARVARATLLAALLAAGATPPDHATVVTLLDGFETRYPGAKTLHPRTVELRLSARIGSGDLAAGARDLDAYLAQPPDGDRRRTLARLGRELVTTADRANDDRRPAALALARKVYAALADRLTLADLDLRAGDAAAARRGYEAALATDPSSAEALRGAARAAAAGGDRAASLGYWRRVLDGSPPGGTAWYEARLAQVQLLAEDGKRGDACQLLRTSHGRATTAGADQLEARLRALEPEVCR